VAASVIGAILIGFLIHITLFMPEWKLMPAMYWIFIGDRNIDREDDDAFEMAAWKTLKLSMTVFFTILILLYEIAVAFFIFSGNPPVINDIQQLQSLDINQIGVWKEAASERILANYVDRAGEYVGPQATKIIPWHRYNSQLEMIGLLANRKIKYVVTFEDDVKYFLYQQRLCGKVTTANLRLRSMGGWHYSSAVPKNVTDSFDDALLQLALDRVSSLGDTYGSRSLDCGDVEQKVDGKVMTLLLSYSIAPLLGLFLLFLLCSIFIKYLRRHQKEQESESLETLATPRNQGDIINYKP